MEAGLSASAEQASVPIQPTRVGTLFTTFFSETEPVDWNTVQVADKVRFGKFFQKMLENGVYRAPSQFEAGFISTRHTHEVMDASLKACELALKPL